MEKRIVVGFTLAFLVLLVGSLIVACNQPQEDTAGPGTGDLDGEALAQERCAAHHDFDRVSSAKKTADEWEATVERMIAHGAKLSEAEKAAVNAHLAEAYPK
jgi:hypothetical protein